MPRALSWILVAAAAIAAGAGVRAQATSQAPAGAPSTSQTAGSGFATSTTAVVVDVVVRDAKGAPIVDLKPSDFELLEDDAKQKIASVELIAPGRASGARSPPRPSLRVRPCRAVRGRGCRALSPWSGPSRCPRGAG